jgi:hypothetical protein
LTNPDDAPSAQWGASDGIPKLNFRPQTGLVMLGDACGDILEVNNKLLRHYTNFKKK